MQAQVVSKKWRLERRERSNRLFTFRDMLPPPPLPNQFSLFWQHSKPVFDVFDSNDGVAMRLKKLAEMKTENGVIFFALRGD